MIKKCCTLVKKKSESPHKNQARHGWSGCDGTYDSFTFVCHINHAHSPMYRYTLFYTAANVHFIIDKFYN